MAFEFKLRALLKHRKRQEEAAQREFAEAKANLDACLATIDQMYQSVEDSRVSVGQLQRQGSPQAILEIRNTEQFMDGQKIRIERERQRARELMLVVEDRQEKLIEAAREHKKIEKLRERRLKEYKKEQKVLENKRTDDLVVIRGRRGVVL